MNLKIIITHILISDGTNMGDSCCGISVLSGSITGTIESPGYPDDDYPSNSDCKWRLEVDNNFLVELKLITFDFSSKLRFRISICLDRDYSCTIFFLYGRIGSRFDSWALPLSGVNTVVTYYKGSHILMNNGSWIDFSKSGCYSTIYTHFLLSISMALNFWCDNWGQSFLPSKSHKSGEISQSGTRFGQHFGQLLSSLWFDFTHTLVDDGQ